MAEKIPNPAETALLIFKGRIERLMREKNLPYVEALKETLKAETPDEYAARNARAVQEAVDQLDSPEYLKRVSEIMADPNPVSREAKRAKFLEENCATLDLEGLHRHVRDNNKRLEQEGVIPRSITSIEDLPESALLVADTICPQCLHSNTTWCGQEKTFIYWFCAFCGHSETQRAKS